MHELANLQINQNMTAQNPVKKNEINPIMLIIEGYPFLARFKTEAVSQFKQKRLYDPAARFQDRFHYTMPFPAIR